MPWLTEWQYRKSHEIIGSPTEAQTDYQVRVVVHYGSGTDSGEDVYLNGKCKSDFGDIRFTDGGGETELPYWMEEKVDGDYAVFWVKVPSIPASPDTATIYIYYGNPSATTTSNGEATFLFFDDFEEGNLNKWVLDEGDGDISLYSTNPIEGAYSIKLHQPVNNYDHVFCYENVERGDIAIHANVKMLSRVDAGLALLIARFDGNRYPATGTNRRPAHAYSAGICVRDQKARIVKYANDEYVLEDVSFACSLNTIYDLEFRLFGSTLRLIINGEEIVNVNDSTYSSGYSGLHICESETIFDVVYIRKYVDPEPSHGVWGSEETVPVIVVIERFQEEGVDFRETKFGATWTHPH